MIKTKAPASFTAWDHYLIGLALLNVESGDNNIDEIINLCDSAILLDDGFCDAYVLKCRCLCDSMFMSGYSHLRSNQEEKFDEFSFAAHNLDPNNPEAVSCYSRSFNLRKDFNQRIKFAKQALDLNPSYAGCNYDYGIALCNEKRFD